MNLHSANAKAMLLPPKDFLHKRPTLEALRLRIGNFLNHGVDAPDAAGGGPYTSAW